MPVTTSAGSWVTPDRETRLHLDSPAYLVTRPPWTDRRRAGQIHRAHTEAVVTERVVLQPGDAWTLTTLADDLTRLTHAESQPQILGASAVNLGTHWTAVDTYRKPTDLPGLQPAGVLLAPSGVPAFTKRVAAGADWSSDLAADSASFPKPVLPSADIPMDRVIVSKGTYPANAGFALTFSTPADYNSLDTLATLYFGGPREGTPAGVLGGEFCISLRGSGELILKEKTGPLAADWTTRQTIAWAQTGRAGNLRLYTVRVFPYGRDSLAITVGEVDTVVDTGGGGFTLLGLLVTIAGVASSKSTRTAGYYRNSPILSGVRPRTHMTGPGPVRVDVRRDLRTYVQLVHLKPQATGTLVDLPFWIPYPVPADTEILVRTDAYLPPNSDPETQQADGVVRLFNATTHAELASIGSGSQPLRFASHANQQAYYAAFDFAADELGEQTPVLYRYQVEVGGMLASRAPATTATYCRSVSVTGPDVTPDQDSAHVSIEDPTDSLTVLRTRARMPAQIRLHNRNSGALISVLFEGEVARANARKKGKSRTYPVPGYRAYDVSLVGVWARLAEHVNVDPMYFDVDEDAPIDPLWNGKPPWKITAVISYCLEKCGFPEAARDIPDLPIRLWPSDAKTEDEFRVQPTASLAEFIQKLAREYLGMVLVWDPNAGAAGLWRLLANPQAPYNVVAHFREGPAAAGRLSMHPNSYSTGEAGIREFESFVRPPECNYVLVVGADMSIPTEVGPGRTAAFMYNAASFDFYGATSDPTNADYLGRYVPVIHCDHTLRTQEACAWVCRRIYDFAAHGQKWLRFTTPLLLITDPLDTSQVRTRPVRINDAVYVTVSGATSTAVVRSCNVGYRSDGAQMQTVEAVVVVS